VQKDDVPLTLHRFSPWEWSMKPYSHLSMAAQLVTIIALSMSLASGTHAQGAQGNMSASESRYSEVPKALRRAQLHNVPRRHEMHR
jgi:hypothetical protein